jgi:hypothetical protein
MVPGVLIKGQSVRPQIGLRFKIRWAKKLSINV